MKFNRIVAGLAVFAVAACSSGPAGPNATGSARTGLFGVTPEGAVSSRAITTDRVRLRRVGGGDIRTGLVTGQVIAVPVNVRLDVWAEIVRLEADRARIVVDWGNGNSDFTGCGACRLENTYTRTGRYTLSIRILDLNAPLGTAPSTSITVTIDVVEDNPRVSLSCGSAAIDFETYGFNVPPPFAAPGVTVSMSIGSTSNIGAPVDFNPELVNVAVFPGTPVTALFSTDKNDFSVGIAVSAPPSAVSYQAFDANGNVVASGSGTPGRSVSGGAGFVGTVSFSTNTPFRSVVITSPLGFNAWAIDNIVGRCQ